MQNLVDQRCFNHHLREAVARCPECTHFFCRECITEHDDRIICAACLRKLARKPSSDRRGFAGLLRFTQFVLGLAAAWSFGRRRCGRSRGDGRGEGVLGGAARVSDGAGDRHFSL